MIQANHYYERYLESTSLKPDVLRTFASDMQTNSLWSIAAKAYQTLLENHPPSGATLLQYGQTLLQLGNVKKAEELFATYFEMRGKNPSDAHTIARALIEQKRFRSAEPYLAALFESKNDNDIQIAFSSLAEIYRDSDRSREITPLVNKFLAKSQNPTRARRLVLTLLQNSGMWKESIEQLKRMRDLRDDSVNFDLGINSYRAGEVEDAREYFESFATNNADPAGAWLAVAQFYTQHALTDDALAAYEQALAINPREPETLIQRGRLNISIGNTSAGIADFQDVADKTNDRDQQSMILGQLIEILEETGNYPQALQVARDAIAKSPTEPAIFLTQIAQHDLATKDPARIDAAIAFLRNESIDLAQLVSILSHNGHVEQAIQLLQQEIEVGDQDVAANIIFDHAHLFVNTGGTERLLNTLRPLLTPPRIPDANLLAAIGVNLIFYQELQLGAQYLEAAIDMGATAYMPFLAHTHLTLGNVQKALTWFQKSLQQNDATSTRSTSSPQDALENIKTRFEMARQSAQFNDLLNVMFTQKEYAAAATPALIHEIINQTNSPEPAFVQLRNSPWMPTANSELSDTTSIEITREVLQTVADRGFILESIAFLDELPEQVRQQRSITELSQRLHLLADTIPALEKADSNNPRETALKANAHARLLMIHGHYDQAQKTARTQLNSDDYLVARDTLEVLLSIARASAQDQTVDDIVKNFIAGAEDKLTARNDAAEQLVRLGYDDIATKLRDQNARAVPVETNVLTALITAQNAGDSKAIEHLVKTYWQVAQTPVSTSKEVAKRLRGPIETEHMAPLLEPANQILDTLPAVVLGKITREFSTGNVENAREMLLEMLESYEFDPRITEIVLHNLSQQGLAVESARFLGPKLTDLALTRNSYRLLGLANLALSLDEDAKNNFDTFLEQSSNPSYAAAELASLLIQQKQYPLALHYAEQAIETHTATQSATLPWAYLSRDIALLGTQTPGQVLPDLQKSATKAGASAITYTQIVNAALHTNNTELAIPFIDKILTTPTHDPYVHYPLQRVLDVFHTPAQARFGASLLEQHYPRIANGTSDIANASTPQITNVFDAAGLQPQVEQLYRSAIRTELTRTPFSDGLATYMNNLAYMYSTSNIHIDRGMDMARRAIAVSSTRSPYLLDTLGWLYYRNGEYTRAESMIRQALRSSNAPPQQNSEYYDHLSHLAEIRGQRQQAIWLQILRDRTRSIDR